MIDGENKNIDDEFNNAMSDDFNTALAISNLFGYFKNIRSKISSGDKSALADISQIRKTYSLIGLFKQSAEKFVAEYEAKTKSDIPENIIALAEERLKARQQKNWAESDRLRDEIAKNGYLIKDAKDGYTLLKQ